MKKVNEFLNVIGDLLEHPLVQEMGDMSQHTDDTPLLQHLLYTSYISYVVCKKLRLNAVCAARGALLHDFRFKHSKDDISQFKWYFTHSSYSHYNATKIFNLNKLEQDIVKKHMWPMTPHLCPRYLESFVVSCADKYCAVVELMGLFKRTKLAKAKVSTFA